MKKNNKLVVNALQRMASLKARYVQTKTQAFKLMNSKTKNKEPVNRKPKYQQNCQ